MPGCWEFFLKLQHLRASSPYSVWMLVILLYLKMEPWRAINPNNALMQFSTSGIGWDPNLLFY